MARQYSIAPAAHFAARRVISPEEAWASIEAELEPLPAQRRPRREALGNVLAEAVTATVDVPAADVSAMDGFALGGALAGGARLPVAGTVAAGDPPGWSLPPGAVLRIATGAPVPAGADRVVPVEQTEEEGDELIVRVAPPAGAHIRRRGEVVRAGDELLPAGTLLTPGALANLAAHGHATVPVHRTPRVAVLTTGNEVVPPEAAPALGQLRDSHTDFLLAAGRAQGLSFESLGIARDERAALDGLVARGLEADVLIVCGGLAKGRLDLVAPVLAARGCRALFRGVAMQPGRPLLVARHAGGWVCALPGNPASVMVGYWLFVRPLLRRLQGSPDGFWHGALTGKLGAPAPGAKDRARLLPATVRFREGRLLVHPVPPVGSHDLAAYARGTALLRVRAGSPPATAGSSCEVLPLADWRGEDG